MTSNPLNRQRRRFATAALPLILLTALVAGCSDDDGGAAAAEGTDLTKVSVALDWTPNTNHIGVYVADELGYYEDAGLDVEVLPYAETPPESLVASGEADFGFSYQAGIAYARASGVPVKQIYANVVKTQYAIGVQESREDIQSPKDLDGKTYAGFGTPDEGPELSYVIKQDGGTGEFETVTLSTAAYDAVYSGQADFTIAVSTWEGIQAELIGKPLRFFEFTDYGFPAQYSTAIAAGDDFLEKNGDTAKAFVEATQKGYQYALDEPEKAAELLLDANPETLKDPELVRESAKVLAAEDYYGDGSTPLGEIDETVWQNYGGFLFDEGLLADEDGKPIATEPDWNEYFTNEFIPGS